jgi:hypothetical protein
MLAQQQKTGPKTTRRLLSVYYLIRGLTTSKNIKEEIGPLLLSLSI